jgi:hypothetical protein
MLAAADHGLDDLAAFLNPEPSRGSVHDQRDVAPSLQHLEHSVVDAVTEHRALELPFALGCMYREKPANVAVTHAVTLARKWGAERCRFGAAAAPVGPALDRVLPDQAYLLDTCGHGRGSGQREIPAGAGEARGASAREATNPEWSVEVGATAWALMGRRRTRRIPGTGVYDVEEVKSE